MTEGLRGIPGGAGREPEFIPLWDRPNLRSILAKGEEDKKGAKIDARITVTMDRAVSRILQQRLLPELETRTDVVNAGIWMLLHYARLKGKKSPDFNTLVSVAEWEVELDALERYEKRITTILDRTERQLSEAKSRGQKARFLKAFEFLQERRAAIEDEGLKGRADAMWVKYREHAKELQG